MQAALQSAIPPDKANEARRFLEMISVSDSNEARRAAGQVQQLLAADAEYVPALMVKVIDQEQQGKFKDAAQSYEAVLRRYPYFAPATRSFALLCFDRLGDDQRAYPLAIQAREAFPDDAQVARMLGVISYLRGDYSRSAQLLAESLRRGTEDAELAYYLGMAHYRLKQKPESKAALQRAIALNLAPKLAAEASRVIEEEK
jgi:tetratricopeptide (TPR) repeat protein